MERLLTYLFISSIIIFIYIIVVLFKFIFAKKLPKETLLSLTGGLGTGKTLNGVNIAIKTHKKMLWLWYFGFMREKEKKKFYLFKLIPIKYKPRVPKPQLYSNIPIKFKNSIIHRIIFKKIPKYEWSKMITYEHLIMTDRIYEYSTILLDEVSRIANQHMFNNPFVMQYIGDFIQFYRHYIDGKLIVTAQSSDEIVKVLRTKLNVIYNLYEFRRSMLFFYQVSVMTIIVTEDVQTIKDSENDDVPYLMGHLPFKWFKFLDIFTFIFGYKKYESRCYKPRYQAKHTKSLLDWNEYFTKYLVDVPNNAKMKKQFKEHGYISQEDMELYIEEWNAKDKKDEKKD